jgi:hypothetical protein
MKLTKAQSFMLSVADFPYLLENTTRLHDVNIHLKLPLSLLTVPQYVV